MIMADFTAHGLLNALIAVYVDDAKLSEAYDLLLHAVQVTLDMERQEAAEWLAEECQERVSWKG